MNPQLDRQDRRNPWPVPGDNPTIRARKIAHMYRQLLHQLDPKAGEEADRRALQYGETWAVPKVVTADDNDLLDPASAADYLCTSTANIRRLRLAGRLNGEETPEGWRYRVGDLRNLQNARPRTVAKIQA